MPQKSEDESISSERRWRLSHLKEQFEALELNKLYQRYNERINHGYFSQFLSLQILLVSTHFIVLFPLGELSEIIPDLIIYGLISILSVIILIVTDLYVKQYPQLLKYFAASAFLIIFFTNFFIPLYNKDLTHNDVKIRPAYTTYLLISNYIFLNVQNTLAAFALGFFVTLSHIVILILVTYKNLNTGDDKLYQRLASDAIYLFCVNGLGIYFRYMNEIVVRRSFLDRRSCIESTIQLKYEEDQESQLMSSIIPQHIIQLVKNSFANENYDGKQSISQPFKDLYVQKHENVTILFADIVNYTAMTTKLNIIELLETLNELFGRFDDASGELKVLRIKFLGDCYYCVSGLPPDPPANHAEACVDLGLKMISIISEIRYRRKLNINMRIGIHTGNVNSGIIGNIKWQYDIWSVDVDIANKMETEGEPGKVHLTRQTKELLSKGYNICQHSKTVNKERTFLISPMENDIPTSSSSASLADSVIYENENEGNTRRSTIYVKRNHTLPIILNGASSTSNSNPSESDDTDYIISQRRDTLVAKRHTVPNGMERRISGMNTLNSFNRRISMNKRVSGERRLTGGDVKRRTAFMNNNIKRYKERLEETNCELRDTIENMLLSKFEQWFKVNEMNRFCLSFKNCKTESRFFTAPDPLFKYYLLSVVLLNILIYLIENLTLPSWTPPKVEYCTSVAVTLFIFIPISWTHYLWVVKYENTVPENKFVLLVYRASIYITKNVWVRIAIYSLVYFIFCFSVLQEWVDCVAIMTRDTFNNTTYRKHRLLEVFLEDFEEECIVPWHMTETCALAIIMSFLFLRMYMWLKLLYAAAIATIYSVAVYFIVQGNFYATPQSNQTFNNTLQPQISHIISVVFLTVTLHLVDRQTEYMNRLDHLWYETLIYKKKQAESKASFNNVLLNNILPKHVADDYKNIERTTSDEFYHENYNDVAVMFASITDFSVEDMGHKFLTIMNTVISEFDNILVGTDFGRPIEKIKIAKWTYMAACGIAPGLGDVENIKKDNGNHAVIALLKFAACLLKSLSLKLNHENFQQMKLRIGISYGPVAGGVVGSKKPLYDIWGHAVNMASRMDTTGLPNEIQVLGETAEIITRHGFRCEYRGNIFVKGPDDFLPTYLVDLTDDFDLVLNRTNSDG